ncbi:MAG: DUF6603 domain-containing protein, partial [Betaproteobacteria bacterium]
MATDLTATIKALLIDFLAPLNEAASDPKVLADWLATLGYGAAIAGDPVLMPIVKLAPAVIAKLTALDAQSLQSWSGLASVLQCGRDVEAILKGLRDFAADPARNKIAAALPEEIMSFLLASYLRRRHATAFRVASLLTLIDARETAAMEAAIVEAGKTLRGARTLDRFKFAAINGLLTQPGATFKDFYFPNGMASGADAWLSAARLFPNLSLLADALGIAWRTEYRPTVPSVITTATETIDPEASIDIEVDISGDVPLPAPPPPLTDAYFAARRPTFRIGLARTPDIAIEISPSSHQHPGAVVGFIVSGVGDFNHSEAFERWKLTVSASGEIPAVAVGPGGVSLVPTGSPGTGGSAKLALERLPASGAPAPAFLLGSANGTRLELGDVQVNAELSYDSQQTAASIGVAAKSGLLVIAPGDGDGFLSSILPADGLQAKFDLGLSWSSQRGLTLSGGAGLETDLPIGFSVAGVSLSSVHIGVQAPDGKLTTEVSASLSASIGPVRAVLDRIGIAGALSFPQNGGNLGLADLDFGFKPPSGIGLSVEAQGVLTGGGFLFHDEAQQLYAGTMQLSLHEQMTLKAFGLIATQMPDGSRGYSMIIFITAEDFRPLPLGMGFTLQGIGGMVAIHRTFNEDVLREGLQNDTLSTLLFPRDPVANAPAIIRALASAFPAQRGSYLLGLLARIGWFTPTLIQMDLALILEFGVRQRLLVLGRISALLPSRENDLVRLNLDAMGVIDFDQGSASIDAVLVDSRLVHKYALTGAMAMRARWTSGPGSGFVLAIGGFNPRFASPAGVPPLARIAIALSSGNNPRLTCDAYFAITSNTVQFGARAQLYAAAYGFNIQGDIGYDVLLQIAPLHFIADFHASVQLKHGSSNLFKVSLAGELEGPRPLRVSGKASFEIFWCDFSVRFDKTLIDGEAPPLPIAVDVLVEVKRALSIAQSWTTQLPVGQSHGVALIKLPPGAALVLDPLGRLAVKQQVAPLNSTRDINTYGGAPVLGDTRFHLTATLNNQPLKETAALQDQFAPAQFFAMSDDEKLASPSFETMDAGLVLGSDAVTLDAAQLVAAPLQYESIILDAPQPPGAPLPPAQPQPYTMPAQLLVFHSFTGAAARAPVRRLGRARFRVFGRPEAVNLAAPRWQIVPVDGGAPAAVDASVRSWSEHQAVLDALNR